MKTYNIEEAENWFLNNSSGNIICVKDGIETEVDCYADAIIAFNWGYKEMEKSRIFRVKSSPIYFDDELNGLKPNTERFTDDWDQTKWNDFYNADLIQVENTDTGKIFSRRIKHKCTYKNIAVISWVH